MTVSKRGGGISTSYHLVNLQVLSLSVQSIRTGKVCSSYLTRCIFALLVPVFVADVIQIAVGGLSALEETFPCVHACTTEGRHCAGGKWSSLISWHLSLQK